jgi:hypothetical protein
MRSRLTPTTSSKQQSRQAQRSPQLPVRYPKASAGLLTLQSLVGNQAVLQRLQTSQTNSASSSRPSGDSQERSAPVPSIVHEVLKSSGHPLEPDVRQGLESRLGKDFSQVRVHTNEKANQSAEAVSARAFTVGRNIVFGAGQYAPHTRIGKQLLTHELTHVLQQRSLPQSTSPTRFDPSGNDIHEQEADRVSQVTASGEAKGNLVLRENCLSPLTQPSLQRAGFIESIARFFGGGTFSENELKNYLSSLTTKKQIEDHYDSDNKAREVIKRWKRGDLAFQILTVPIRILLIREMASGYLSGDDQQGILDLLSESIPSELKTILANISVNDLKPRFDGDRRKQFDQLLEQQDIDSLSLFSGEWTLAGVQAILHRHGDEHIIQTIRDRGIKIIRFETAFDKWRYDDGRVEENELTGLRGNTAGIEIRIRKSLSNEEAASTLFHEVSHFTSTQPDYLEQEIEVRVETEEFQIRHGLPPSGRDYRKPDGTVNEAAIRREITSSPHYNPTGRRRIGRRYVGETEVVGWSLP